MADKPEGVKRLERSREVNENLSLKKQLRNACNEIKGGADTEFSKGTCEILDENGDTEAVIEANDSAKSLKAFNEPDTNVAGTLVGEEDRDLEVKARFDQIELIKNDEKGLQTDSITVG